MSPATRNEIPSASIIISWKRNVIEQILKKAGQGSNLLSPVGEGGVALLTSDDKEFLLFDNTSNPNLINFEHTFGVNAGDQTMTLSFIDPFNEFESRFVNTDLESAVGGSFPSIHTPPPPEGRALTTEQAAEFQRRFTTAFGNKHFYIAYGLGTNTDVWAGPHSMMMSNATIEIKGSRKITLEFQPVLHTISPLARRGPRGEVVNINLGGLNSYCRGESDKFNFAGLTTLEHSDSLETRLLFMDLPSLAGGGRATGEPIYGAQKPKNPRFEEESRVMLKDEVADFAENNPAKETHPDELGEQVFIEQRTKYGNLLTGLLGESGVKFIEKIDLHLIVTDILKDYISKATQSKNVIVLLPDLNYVCSYVIKKIIKEIEAKNIASSLEELWRSLRDSDISKPELIHIIKTQAILEDLLNTLGLRLVLDDGMTDERHCGRFGAGAGAGDLTGSTERQPHQPRIHRNLQRWMSGGGEGYTTEPSEHGERDAQQLLMYWVDSVYKAFRMNSVRGGLPDHEEAIYGVYSLIQKMCKGFYPLRQPLLITETNVKFSKYWKAIELNMWNKENLASPIRRASRFFGGRHTFDPNEPTIIFGDPYLISNFLYGEGDFDLISKNLADLVEKEKIAKYVDRELDYLEVDIQRSMAELEVGWAPDPSPDEEPASLSPLSESQRAETEAHLLESRAQINRLAPLSLQNLKIGQQNLVPLHPVERVIFTQGYGKYIRSLVSPPIENTYGPFGHTSYWSKSEAEQQLEGGGTASEDVTESLVEEFRDSWIKRNVPIFRFNVENPNVSDLKYKFGSIYFVQLQLMFHNVVRLRGAAITTGLSEDSSRWGFVFGSGADVLNYLIRTNWGEKVIGDRTHSWADVENDIIAKLDPGYSRGRLIGTELRTSITQTAKLAVDLYKTVLNNRTGAVTIPFEQGYPGNPVAMLNDFIVQMYRKAVQVDITTLPLFHLSNVGNISKNCMLIGQDLPVISQVHAGMLPPTALARFFTGSYQIFRFKHVINAKGKAYSEFGLIKNLSNAIRGTLEGGISSSAEGFEITDARAQYVTHQISSGKVAVDPNTFEITLAP